MDNSAKRIMVNLSYFSLMTLLVLFNILFIVILNMRTLSTYQSVAFNVWAGLFFIILAYDIYATVMRDKKLISGLMMYGLAFLFLILAIVVFITTNTNGIIPQASYGNFHFLIYIPFFLTIGSFVLYHTGLKRIKITENE